MLAHLYLTVLLLSPLGREDATTFFLELRLHIQVYKVFSWRKLSLRSVWVESCWETMVDCAVMWEAVLAIGVFLIVIVLGSLLLRRASWWVSAAVLV